MLPMAQDGIAEKWLALMPQAARDIITERRLQPGGSLVWVKDDLSTPTLKE